MKFTGRFSALHWLAMCGLAVLTAACGDDAEEQLDNPTSVTDGTQRLCIGQIVAVASTSGGVQEQVRTGYPSAAWRLESGNLVWDEDQFDLERSKTQGDVELCGMPPESTLPPAEFIARLETWAGAPCFCGVGDVSTTEQTECETDCEALLDSNPAIAQAPGDYDCQNDVSLYLPATAKYSHDTGVSCMGSIGQPLKKSTGGISSFTAFGRFHLSAADGRVNTNGIGVIQYSADVSDLCVDGCNLVINRITMSFNDSSYEDWDFTNTYALSQGPILGSVDDQGDISVPAGAGSFVVQFDSNGKTGNFVDSNNTGITGTFDPVTGAITLSSVVVDDGDLTVSLKLTEATVVASPPRPQFSPTGELECNARFGREVQLSSAGSFDPDGDLDRFHWVRNDQIVAFGPTTTVFFGLGDSEVALNAFDRRGAINYKRDTITVVDTTPPVWGNAPLVDLTSCDAFVDHHALTPPEVSDVCTDVVSIKARIVSTDGVVRPVPLDIDYEDAVLPGGEHVIEWIATDTYGNESSTFQTVRLGPAVVATDRLSVRDRAKVVNQAGALAAVGSTGPQVTQLGVSSRLAEVLSVGPVFLQNYAAVTGRVTSASWVQSQQGATAGLIQQFASVPLGSIPWLAPYLGTSFGTNFVSIEPDQTLTLGNGAYGTVSVKSRATLFITGNALSFRALEIEPTARVVVTQPEATLVVDQRFVQRGTWDGNGGWVRLVVFGNEALLEAPVFGFDIIAPNARVPVATSANGSTVRQLVGREVEIAPDVVLKCNRTSTLD